MDGMCMLNIMNYLIVTLTAIAGSNPKFILMTSQNKAPVTKPNDIWLRIAAMRQYFEPSLTMSIAEMTEIKAAVTCVQQNTEQLQEVEI